MVCGLGVQAQNGDEKLAGFIFSDELRACGLSLNNHSEFKAMDWEITPGYGINRRFSVLLPLTASLGLFDKDDMKTYRFAGMVGVGVGYNPLHTADSQLELSAKAGSSIGGDWHSVYYDFGVRYGFGGYKSCHNFFLGVGVRYFDAFKGNFDNYCTLYGTLGFRINRYKSHR